eukprot:Skav217632  [mRNA]  locus=scaffold2613:183127:188920:+ [translate_table: standard]
MRLLTLVFVGVSSGGGGGGGGVGVVVAVAVVVAVMVAVVVVMVQVALEKEVAEMAKFEVTVEVTETDSQSSGPLEADLLSRESVEKEKQPQQRLQLGSGSPRLSTDTNSFAVEAASKEGERRVAAACARIAVSRYLEKAKASIESETLNPKRAVQPAPQSKGKEQGWKQHFPEAVKRNESKAFERAVEQGDPREVAAMCARHAAKETIQRGNMSACSAVEQAHYAVVKAVSKIAAVTQPTIDDLQGCLEDEDPASPYLAWSQEFEMLAICSPKEEKSNKAVWNRSKEKASNAEGKDWTAPPSPEQFEVDVKKAATKQKQNAPVRKLMKTDLEEELRCKDKVPA